MEIVDRGSGPPLVLIPGLQGRWEYLRPAVDALSACFRVLTFSLDADGGRFDPETAVGLDRYAETVASVLSMAEIERATICGVSFGGLIAARFAARYPTRCDSLILASTPRRWRFKRSKKPAMKKRIFFSSTPPGGCIIKTI